jgi:RNA polymerase sigma-70 factor (sigma-E family)
MFMTASVAPLPGQWEGEATVALGDVTPTAVDVSALYVANRVGLVRLAVLLVDDEATAQDIVQDAFIGLHRNGNTLRDPDAGLAYLRQATVNGARSALRRRRTARAHLDELEPRPGPGSDEALLLADEQRRVLVALRSLPRRDQEVLVLRYWSHMSEAQIAETLGVSRGTVKSTASRAIAKLAERMSEEGR